MNAPVRTIPGRRVEVDPELIEAINRIAVSYVRQSSAKADSTEASPETQRTKNEEESLRWGTFRRHYEDIGISGWDADAEREGFEAMLADARAGLFQVLIVYNVSRFSRREVADAIPVVAELHRLGITIVSVMEGVFAPRDSMALIYLIMRLDASHQESENKSQAVRDVKAAQRDAGSWLGGAPPYGLRAEKEIHGKLAIYRLFHEDEETANLRQIWSTIKLHKDKPIKPGKKHPGSLSGICTDMNEKGIPTRGQRTGKERADSQWHSRTLKGILLNPAIAGMSYETLYKVKEDGTLTKTVEGYRINRDDEGRPIMICEPIIPPAEWYELQDWLAGRGRGQGLSRGTSLLASLKNEDKEPILTCECGRPMTSLNAAATDPKVKPVYRCTRAPGAATEDEHQGGNAIMMRHLDEFVARRIFALILASEDDPEVLPVIAAATKTFARSQESPEVAAERNALVAERADATRALVELYDDLDANVYSGRMGRDRFLSKKAKVEARIDAAETRLAGLRVPEEVVLPLSEWLSADPEADPVGEGSWWQGADRNARRSFVSLFVRSIVVSKAESRWGHSRTAAYDVEPRVGLDWVRVTGDGEDDHLAGQE
ncbi:recombinase family protein [Kitasatospora sp. NPDC051853]|uniref:recombinase family protein n=1 Tax=Kitasatospora sp. NPDC051853 TaxID=3364058 RepID=UPI0037B82798